MSRLCVVDVFGASAGTCSRLVTHVLFMHHRPAFCELSFFFGSLWCTRLAKDSSSNPLSESPPRL